MSIRRRKATETSTTETTSSALELRDEVAAMVAIAHPTPTPAPAPASPRSTSPPRTPPAPRVPHEDGCRDCGCDNFAAQFDNPGPIPGEVEERCCSTMTLRSGLRPC